MSLTTALEEAKKEAVFRDLSPQTVVAGILKRAFEFAVDEAQELLREDRVPNALKAEFDAIGVSVVKVANFLTITLPDGRVVETTEEALEFSAAPLMDTLMALADGQTASKVETPPEETKGEDTPPAPSAESIPEEPKSEPVVDESSVRTPPVEDAAPASVTDTPPTETTEVQAPETAPTEEAAPPPVQTAPEADTVAPAPEAKSESKKGRKSAPK
jgi:hypothetical protein